MNPKVHALRTILPLCGFKEDAFGHFQRDTQGRTLSGAVVDAKMRVKIQERNVRVELKKNERGAMWTKIEGAYLTDVHIESDKVRIGKKIFQVED